MSSPDTQQTRSGRRVSGEVLGRKCTIVFNIAQDPNMAICGEGSERIMEVLGELHEVKDGNDSLAIASKGPWMNRCVAREI